MEYQQVQKIAKDAIEYARNHIKAGMNHVIEEKGKLVEL